ncbi:MAG: flagellar hook-associated protein FlgK [Bdellovibrionales bacterium]|nr:flagellar hook-associated protein FlgK [Bdellovibrionales bacterium]
MSRIWSMMDVGRRSMMNSQTALQTTSHNIANKSTEGYSRQRVEMLTNQPIGEGKLRMGMGARAGLVTRTNNEFLEKNIERESNQMGYLDARSELLGRVEQVYNEQVNKGLNHSLGSFFNSFRELSNNPESLATRTQVKEAALGIANDFKKVHDQLEAIKSDADFRIRTRIEEVNQLTKEIANLNEKVQTVELTGVPANDERDRREVLLKQLGEKINIRYAEGKDGQLTITAGNTAVLVSGYSQRDLIAQQTPEREGKREGNLDIFYKSTDNSTPVLVSGQLTGGEVGAMLEVRDKMIGEISDGMDQVAYALATEVNTAHAQGYDRAGRTGNFLFEQPQDVRDAAFYLKVSDEVLNDVGRVAAAGAPGAPGDNRIANILSGLEYKQVMDDGTSTFNDYYASVVGRIGIETQRANSAASAQRDIVGQLKNIRESISGVSLDEETTKMIEFQKAFDASARLIKTADEMLDTVLRLKPM